MAEKSIGELSPEAREERERCLAVLDMFKEAIPDYYIPIYNRILGGNDPRDPDYMADRLMP